MPQFSDDLFLGSAPAYQGTGNYPSTGIISATIASTTLTVAQNLSGDPLVVGQYVTGSSVTAGTYITALTSSTTATLNTASTVSSATTMYLDGNGALNNPAPMSTGIGPLGRTYIWDVIPQAVVANNLVTSTTPSSLSSTALTLTAGTSTVSTVRSDGTTATVLDVPRAVTVTNGSYTAPTYGAASNIATAASGAGGSAGAFVLTSGTTGITVGQTVTVTGTNSGTSGLAAGTYIISATNGTTTFTLVTTAGAAITTTAAGSNTGLTFTGTLTARTVTVSGYDYYGQAMTSTITTSTASAGTATSTKAFYQVTGISINAASGGSITVGTSDVLGFPVRVLDAGYLVSIGWNNTVARDTGGSSAFVAAVTATATSGTGDVRGTYKPSSASDGTKRLVVAIALPNTAVGPNATQAGALGITQA